MKAKDSISPLLESAINGNSDSYIVRETCRKMDKQVKETGNDTVTIADMRRMRAEIFRGKT